MSRAVIFDLDGTLLNTLGDLADSVNFVLDSYGYPKRSVEEVNSFIGNGVGELIRRALPVGAEDKFDGALAKFKEYYSEHSNIKTHVYDGLIPVLERLRSDGYKIGVVTNKVDFAAKSLCREYFGSLIDIAIGDRAGHKRKPAPDSVLEAMKLLGCDSAIYVGDSDVDIATARNSLLPCICVTWGFRDKDFLKENGGDLFADNADELYEIIKGAAL